MDDRTLDRPSTALVPHPPLSQAESSIFNHIPFLQNIICLLSLFLFELHYHLVSVPGHRSWILLVALFCWSGGTVRNLDPRTKGFHCGFQRYFNLTYTSICLTYPCWQTIEWSTSVRNRQQKNSGLWNLLLTNIFTAFALTINKDKLQAHHL